jgi:hypothetical protein
MGAPTDWMRDPKTNTHLVILKYTHILALKKNLAENIVLRDPAQRFFPRFGIFLLFLIKAKRLAH